MARGRFVRVLLGEREGGLVDMMGGVFLFGCVLLKIIVGVRYVVLC